MCCRDGINSTFLPKEDFSNLPKFEKASSLSGGRQRSGRLLTHFGDSAAPARQRAPPACLPRLSGPPLPSLYPVAVSSLWCVASALPCRRTSTTSTPR